MPDTETTLDVPVRLAYAPAVVGKRPMLWHSGMTLPRFFSLHVMGAMLPITAGMLLYGWRALLLTGIVVASAAAAIFLWKRIGSRGRQLRFSHGLWLALLLSLMLPAHLVTGYPPFDGVPGSQWAIAAGAGILVISLAWLLGGAGSGRVHPSLVAYLLIVVLFKDALVPHWVLQKDHLFLGDLTKSERNDTLTTSGDPWIHTNPIFGRDGIYQIPASEQLFQFTSGGIQLHFTSGHPLSERKWLSLDSLLRDEMPPLEDLIMGGQPGPVGAASAIAVIVGGLFLLYRAVIDFRIPLLIVLAAFVALLILPVPVVVREVVQQDVSRTQAAWRWLALRDHDIGAAKAITFANYEIMAGPLLFVAFFLATAPAVRPMARRGRCAYALMIGLLAAFLQLYVSVSFGAYLALLLVSALTPSVDKMFCAKPLV